LSVRLPTGIDRLPAVGEAAICMGVFDGVHRGHLALVQATVDAARRGGLKAVALVFDPHPDEVVRPGKQVARLAPLHENLRRLVEAGIQAPVPVRFDEALRALTAEEFLVAMAPAIRVRRLVMSLESAFGRDRGGTADAMERFGRSAGFEVTRVEGLVMDDGEPISSGRIRGAVTRGNLGEAGRLLGHPAFLEGVLRSDGDASRLTFIYHPAIPAPGEYRARIREVGARMESDEVLLGIGQDGVVGVSADGLIDGQRLAIDLLSRA
jgi:riboflavin kinase / FMN adenylyltransferase